METWFTADEHHGHANIIRHCGRPFAGTAEMTAEIVARHNARVAGGDLVYHLGDFAWGTDDPGAIRALLDQLNGRHVLVAGNHDACSEVHRRWQRGARRYFEAGFEDVVTDAMVIQHDDLGRVLLGHFPPLVGSEDDRYAAHRPTHLRGARFQLCGHVHERWAARLFPGVGLAVNVGVDRWAFAPVSVPQIRELVEMASRGLGVPA